MNRLPSGKLIDGSDANDPTKMRPWTSEWYSPSSWEGEDGSTFYDSFVFERHYGGDLQGRIARVAEHIANDPEVRLPGAHQRAHRHTVEVSKALWESVLALG